ncbi:MAG TPA: OmpH family outer membrane protein [Deltaproteobacteria bacterium]|jgi:outer membrane protein|nr:OmpH family outer membrane protein [Deltaproteobacteria bacterium]HOI07864.1 OmpH family outer membrane protein [Deltaproteobacteria bacterium]
MKRFIPVAVALLIALPGLVGQVNAADLKIAYIDSQRILTDSIAGKEAYAQLEKISNERRKEIDKMQEKIKKLGEEIQAKGATMKEAAKAELQSKYESEVKSLNRFAKDADEELRRKQLVLVKPISDEVNEIIADYGKKNDIDLIFDTRAPGMVFNSAKGDITDAILKLYDAKHKKTEKTEKKK